MIDEQEKESLVLDSFWKLLGKKSSLLGKGLIDRLAAESRLDRIATQGALASLSQKRILGGIHSNGIPINKVIPLVDRPITPASDTLQSWTGALEKAGLEQVEIDSLSPLHQSVSDMTEEDKIRLILGLKRLKQEQSAQWGKPSFLVSAEYLLNSSKILDNLQSKHLQSFGIQTERFTGAPPVLLVAGPSCPSNVVLVENPHAFWAAVDTKATDTTAFVVTFGYGLSRHSDDFGNQLASVIEGAIKIKTAVCQGSPPSAPDLLANPKLNFWGDLDVEGLRIFLRLQKKLPNISLSALYLPMLRSLNDPAKSHGYIQIASKHKQIKRKEADCRCHEDLLKLFSLCSERAVDQEAVTREQIEKYGQFELSSIFSEEVC